MAPPRLILEILQVLRSIPLKRLIQSCRGIWIVLWRSCREHVFRMRTKRSILVPSRQPMSEYGGGTERQEVKPRQDVPIPIPDVQPAPQLTTIPYSGSTQSFQSSSSSIALQIVPPESPTLQNSSDHRRSEGQSSQGEESLTLTSMHMENDISRQEFVLQPSYISGSRRSLVIPAAPSLRIGGDVAQIGGSGTTGFSEGISDYIYPLMPSKVPRYKRDRKIDVQILPRYELGAAQKEFTLGTLPRGWEAITHPEGQPYFYHAEKKVVTENWIWDEHEITILEGFIEQIEDFSRSRNLYQPPDTHLVLEITEEDDEVWCGYYYACASTRSLLWLEPFDISRFLSEVRGVSQPPHIKSYLEVEYWNHWDLFPNVNKATRPIYDLVMNVISDSRTDVVTSEQATVNHTRADLKEMAEIVKSSSKRMDCDNSSWCIGRFMALLMRDRWLNFHGQFGARLNRSQSIYGRERHQRTWFIKLLSPILFAAPNIHLNAMEELWVDRLTLKTRCEEFFSKLNTQWGEHIVHASILLNANVAFLAIPSNDPSNNSTDVIAFRYPAQIASYLSVVASFASMLTALMLVRQHKPKERASVAEFRKFLRKQDHPKRGFEALASVYSLPYALLTWGMVTFILAFMLMCFGKSNAPAQTIVGISAVLLAVLIVWCIAMAWEETEFQWRRLFKAKLGLSKKSRTDGDEKDQLVSSWLQHMRTIIRPCGWQNEPASDQV